jgi:hypothetical protein
VQHDVVALSHYDGVSYRKAAGATVVQTISTGFYVIAVLDASVCELAFRSARLPHLHQGRSIRP